MTRTSRYVLAALIAVLTALAGTAAAPGAQSASGTGQTIAFSGQATALKGTILGIPIELANTGPVAAEGGELEESVACYAMPDSDCLVAVPDLTNNTVHARALHAAVVSRGNKSRAEASVAEFNLSVAGQRIAAELLRAEAEAKCTGRGATVKGGGETSVTINGTKYTVAAGETMTIPLFDVDVLGNEVQVGSVTLNEGASPERSGNEINVTALHIVLNDLAGNELVNLEVAKVHADIVCGQTPGCPGQNAFVTGGGYIAPGKQHFAIAGRNLANWGHVLYKPANVHVKKPYAVVFRTLNDLEAALPGHSFTFTRSVLRDPNTFEGAAIISWYAQDGELLGEVLAIDMGEPGRGDFFEIANIGNVAAAAGLLEGGNIQMHGKC